MAPELCFTDDPSGAEFREPPGERGVAAALWTPRRGFERLASFLEARLPPDNGARFGLPGDDSIEARLTAAVDALAARGEVHRDRLGWWCEQAGVPYERASYHGAQRVRERVTRPLAQAVEPDGHLRTLLLHLRLTLGLGFEERYEHPAGRYGHSIDVDLDQTEPLIRRLRGRLGLFTPAPASGWEVRAAATFDGLVERGELGTHLPPRANRDRVAGWCRDAGVRFRVRDHPSTVTRSGPPHDHARTATGSDRPRDQPRTINEPGPPHDHPRALARSGRRETLLQVHRAGTDCRFRLTLTVGTTGITFTEDYEYFPRPGDPGREYAYHVRTPYTSMRALVDGLEARLGTSTGELDDRLVRCFRVLVERGELADGLPLRAAQKRVAGWFRRAGVPAELDRSHWFSS